jgi:DNA-binding PadR family transcriptional regulator
MSKLSELEGAVLGVLWTEGPCTAYAVRKTFQSSPSPQWSGSAGAIYPLVRRLQAKGFAGSRAQPGDRRGGRLYSLTSRGLKALQSWMAPPLSEDVTGVPMDPLRTRLEFLGALTPGMRRAFVKDARLKLEEHIAATRADCRATRGKKDPARHLVARGALIMLLARKDWLKEVSRSLRKGSWGR